MRKNLMINFKQFHSVIVLSAILILILSNLAGAVSPPDETQQAQLSKGSATVLNQELALQQMPNAVMIEDSDLGELPGAPRTEADIIETLKTYISLYPHQFGDVKVEQLKQVYVSTIPGVDAKQSLVYVQFVQQQEGLDVEGSFLNFVIKILPGKTLLVSTNIKVFLNLKMGNVSSKNQAALRSLAVKGLGLSSAKSKTIPLKEIRKLRFIDGSWRRVSEIQYDNGGYKAVVDEDTGETWAEDDRHYVSGDVKGLVSKFKRPINNPTPEPLPLKDLKVRAKNGNSALTASDGTFSLSVITATKMIAPLHGKWVNVTTFGNDKNLKLTKKVSLGDTPHLLFNPARGDENGAAQVNAYYHTTFIHDWIKSKLNSTTAVDQTIEMGVNDIGCNGWYVNNEIRLAGNDYGCPNSGYDTVIYHEYGHFIDDKFGGIQDNGLSEGWGDVLATYATDQPLIGQLGDGRNPYIRTADNNYQFNTNDRGHTLGQAWAGFAWHLREDLISKLGNIQGKQKAEQLVLTSVMSNSVDIPSAVYDVLLIDDDNGLLGDGSPNMEEIAAAARRHSIPWKVASNAQIIGPKNNALISRSKGSIDIFGTTASSSTRFELKYGVGTNPFNWTTIRSVAGNYNNSRLATWSIGGLPNGTYTLQLKAYNGTTVVGSYSINVILSN